MIYFDNYKCEIYNKIIHRYLEIEVFGDRTCDVGDKIELYMPKYLYREQYQKCIDIFTDLYEWTDDIFLHNFTAFHEVALYYFLIEMKEIKKDTKKEFYKIYYDQELEKEIEKYLMEDSKKFEKILNKDEIKEFYYDPNHICGEIFEDIDFVELPYLYNEYKLDMPIIAEMMGINIDYYFEILPIDIQRNHKSKKLTLVGEISGFFVYIQQRINQGSLVDLFWENDKQINESKVHIILENMMDAYFLGKNVDISREVLIGNGKIDFKLFRNNNKNEKVLIEVKKASSSHLKAGYEKQLCDYIRFSEYKNAFYLIVCFTDNEYRIAHDFIKNHVYTDNYQMYINIAILDARRKLAPSKKKIRN